MTIINGLSIYGSCERQTRNLLYKPLSLVYSTLPSACFLSDDTQYGISLMDLIYLHNYVFQPFTQPVMALCIRLSCFCKQKICKEFVDM